MEERGDEEEVSEGIRTGVKDAATISILKQQLHRTGAVERVEGVHPHLDLRGPHQHLRGRVHLCTEVAVGVKQQW